MIFKATEMALKLSLVSTLASLVVCFPTFVAEYSTVFICAQILMVLMWSSSFTPSSWVLMIYGRVSSTTAALFLVVTFKHTVFKVLHNFYLFINFSK